MMRWRLPLLIFSALTLHGCLSADPDLQDEISIGDIVDLYNQREGVTYLYKALEEIPPVPLKDGETSKRKVFIIKETECLKSANPDPSQCDVKQDGDVKICSLDFGVEDPEELICTRLTQRFNRRRSQRRRCPRPGEGSPLFKPCRRI